MPFYPKLAAREAPTLSYEFFPPKNPAGWGTLYGTLGEVAKLAPDFVSVTYGAGGSTRTKTVDLVSRIQGELNLEAVAHLTCVGHSREELHSILTSLQRAGIGTVLALRGDPPKGDLTFKPHPDGFAHASELIAYIKEHFPFRIGCAFYPEKHVEAPDLETDIRHLKAKQDAGADFAVSQLFFDNDLFRVFREKAAARGVSLPLVCGIMPVTDAKQLPRFQELSGCSIPAALRQAFAGETDAMTTGVDFATQQCLDLIREGVDGLHLYCLNRAQSILRITENLRAAGHFPLPA